MNVLLIFSGKRDSGPAFTLGVAEGLAQCEGVNVYCLLSNQIENKDKWIKQKRIKCILVDTGDIKSFPKKMLKYFIGNKGKKIRDELEKIKFDVCIQTFGTPWAFIFMKGLSIRHKMVICHDPCPHTGESLLNRNLANFQYKHTDEIIVLTKKFVAIVESKFGTSKENIYCIRHGLFNSYKDCTSSQPVQFDKDKINFLFFGRVEKYKGIGLLIEAYKKLKNEQSKITLTIAGNGNMDEYEKSLSDESDIRVINRYITDEEINGMFSAENVIVVLPYLDATQSGIIPIAVDFEVPVIASDSEGLIEQLDDGRIGIIFKTGSVEALYNAMHEVIEKEGILKNEKEKMNNFAYELKWENIMKKLLIEIEERNSLTD